MRSGLLKLRLCNLESSNSSGTQAWLDKQQSTQQPCAGSDINKCSDDNKACECQLIPPWLAAKLVGSAESSNQASDSGRWRS